MSFTYVLRTSQANILPATYPITITAFQEGLPQFTTSLQVQVTAVAVVGDTVRTIAELLTVIWADGQMEKQLTPQDGWGGQLLMLGAGGGGARVRPPLG